MNIISRWRTRYARSRLLDQRFSTLFDPPPPDEYVSLDCETSSFDPKSAELISVAAVRIIGNRIEMSKNLDLLIRPEGEIDPSTIPIHGLRLQDTADGLPVREAMEQLIAFIGPRPIIGYYLEFDTAIINRHVRPWLGINLPNTCIDVSGLYYDRHVSAYRPEVDLSLQSILATLDLPDIPRHNALQDALTTALIWLKLKQR